MRRTYRHLASLALCSAVIVSATHAFAQDDPMAARRNSAQALMERAEALQETNPDAAHRLRQRAERMLSISDEQVARDQPHARERRIIEGLEHGIGALRELGRHEEAEHLRRLAAEVRMGIGREQGEQQRKQTEREVAMRQLEVLRMALPALREGERRDAAELLQRAIRIREMALEGRNDEEAKEFRRSGPNRGQIAEILMLSSRLWAEFGHESKSHSTGELGRQLAEQERARRDRATWERDEGAALREREMAEREAMHAKELAEREAMRARELAERARHEAMRAREAHEHVEHLQHQIEEMMGALEEMHHAMREMQAEIRKLRDRDGNDD